MQRSGSMEAQPSLQEADKQAHDRAPIYEALRNYHDRKILALHMPAHRGILGPPGQEQFLTLLGLACDLPSLDETDNTFHPRGCVAEAQHLAAELWGASDTFFLVNGSTIGVQAMMLAAVSPGDTVLLSRQVHLSVLSALVLSGAKPVYLPPHWLDFAGPIPPSLDELSFYLSQNANARAVLLTHPSYYGLGRDLQPFASLCHRYGIPLLVDEAHGAHLRFLGRRGPCSALESGADVVVQSMHKTVGSLVGTAMLHRGHGSLVARERLQAALNLLQSTSSSYLLLASLDLTRRWMSQFGTSLFEQAVDRVEGLRGRLEAIPNIRVLSNARHPHLHGCGLDPLRLVIDVSGLGGTGFAIERRLLDEFKLLGEFADSRNVIYVLGPADSPDSCSRLEQALATISRQARSQPADDASLTRSLPLPPVAVTPREAAFRPRTRLPLRAALGRVCGEVITMYPPGIPLICPGEEFTREVLDYCEYLVSGNACIFAEDASLSTVSVLED